MTSVMNANGSRRIAVLVLGAALAACERGGQAPPPELPPPPTTTTTTAAEAAEGQAPAEEIVIGADDGAYTDTDPSALTDFRPALDAHGAWVDDDTYGTVWVPGSDEVGSDFMPYVTRGHWVYDDDYVWVSDYPWGWVTFHYGRWVWIAGRGWAWVPGRVYAGAWVSWRTGADDFAFVGWGPLPPVWIWRGGVAIAILVPIPAPFVFCERDHLFAPIVVPFIVPPERAPIIERRTHAYAVEPHGPPPDALHIAPPSVAHPSPSDRGLGTARAYADPRSAGPLGATPPSSHGVRVAPPHPSSSHPSWRAPVARPPAPSPPPSPSPSSRPRVAPSRPARR